MKLLLILGVSLTFLTAIFTSGYNDKPGIIIKVMCFLAHHFLSIIYNTFSTSYFDKGRL